MRDKLDTAIKNAMRAKAVHELSTLRLMSAAIKSKDIELRVKNGPEARIADDEILAAWVKMVKQRKESAETYQRGGRPELEARELAEIEIINAYLPKAMSLEQTDEAISDAIVKTGAVSAKDMGKVIAHLRENFAGQMDFGQVSGMIKKQFEGK